MSPSKYLSGNRRLRTAIDFSRCFLRAREAFAAAEFALIAPLMITMYFGVSELTDGYSASSKVTSVASTAADLVAQENSICNAEVTDIYAALDAIMFPYPAGNMKVVISSLVDGGGGTVRVAWSDAKNASPRGVNSTVSIPSGLMTTGGSVILTEVNYDYSSPTGNLIYGVIPLSDKFYLHPRRTAQITRTSSC